MGKKIEDIDFEEIESAGLGPPTGKVNIEEPEPRTETTDGFFGGESDDFWDEMNREREQSSSGNIFDEDEEASTEEPKFHTDTDEAEMFFRGMVGLLDETRAAMLASMIVGDFEKRDDYLYYKDLSSKKHSEFVRAGTYLIKKYSIKGGPEFVIFLSLGMSTLMMVMKAQSDRKKAKKTKEDPKQENGKKQTKKNTDGGKEIPINKKTGIM